MWPTVALRAIIRSYVSIMLHDRFAQGQNRRHHAGCWPLSRSCRFRGHLRPARGSVFAVHASARGSDSNTRQPLGSNRRRGVSRRRRPRVGGATIERLTPRHPPPPDSFLSPSAAACGGGRGEKRRILWGSGRPLANQSLFRRRRVGGEPRRATSSSRTCPATNPILSPCRRSSASHEDVRFRPRRRASVSRSGAKFGS